MVAAEKHIAKEKFTANTQNIAMDLWNTRPMICKTSKDLPSFTSLKRRVKRRTRSTVKLDAVELCRAVSTKNGIITLGI